MPGETINLAELVGDLRLLKDKVAALEKTNNALASALTRTVQQAIEKTDSKFEREMKLVNEHVGGRVTSIGEAINARFGERIAKMDEAIATLQSTRDDLLAVAGKTQRSAESAAKSVEVAKLFGAKLDMLDDKTKHTNTRLEEVCLNYVDAEEHKLIKSRLDALEKKSAQVRR
jgi:hypothetical protein